GHGRVQADRLEDLRAVSLFAHCSSSDLGRIARVADEIQVEPGRVLMTEGEIGREAFIVLDARVEVTTGDEVVATLGPAQPVGEMALLERVPRNATVTVSQPGSVLVIGQREFAGLLEEPSFSKAIMIALADRLREIDKSYVG
ncbi:MAG: cyclic nucleotide-binding domain-containing protein, partial [Actinomycetota bacterium]